MTRWMAACALALFALLGSAVAQTRDPRVTQFATDLLERTRRPAIAILRDKPSADNSSRSYFGGLPRMPTSLSWPESRATHAPMSFLAQIDLSELPPSARQQGLPETGVLWFFAAYDGTLDERERVAVLYAEGSSRDWAERQPPRTLGRIIDEQPYTWLDPGDPLARLDLRTPIHFAAIRSYRVGDAFFSGQLASETRDIGDERLREDIERALGRAARNGPEVFNPPAVTADEQWPSAGLFAELGASAIRAALPFVERRSFRPEAADWTAEGRRLRQVLADEADREARRWRARRYQPLSNEERAAFRAWVASVKARADASPEADTSGQHLWTYMTDYGLKDSRTFGAYAMMAHGADAALIPAEYRADYDWLGNAPPLHQLLGYGFSWQSAPADHAADVLLLQINGWPDLFWLTESGCTVGFWISRPALSARRFDLVSPTLECD